MIRRISQTTHPRHFNSRSVRFFGPCLSQFARHRDKAGHRNGLGAPGRIDIGGGRKPQGIVPAGAWQSAESTGDWTLVGCTVAPGFEFAGFEMAMPDFEPAV